MANISTYAMSPIKYEFLQGAHSARLNLGKVFCGHQTNQTHQANQAHQAH